MSTFKLNDKQIAALLILNERILPFRTPEADVKTLQSLMRRNLIIIKNYQPGGILGINRYRTLLLRNS